MKRSEINQALKDARRCFEEHGWALPPNPRWDVTDFGLGDFPRYGLVLVNLAEEPEYCEKLMYARRGQRTPNHAHRSKKEDIICRCGVLAIDLYHGRPGSERNEVPFLLKVNGEPRTFRSGATLRLTAGERVTLTPEVYHEFYPESDACILGEVSTRNDDEHDNFFVNADIGRFPEVIEDEPPLVRLVGE